MAAIDRESQIKQVADIIFSDLFDMSGDEGIVYSSTFFSTDEGQKGLADVLADYMGDNAEKIIDLRFLELGGNAGLNVNVEDIQPVLSTRITEYLALPEEQRAAYRQNLRLRKNS